MIHLKGLFSRSGGLQAGINSVEVSKRERERERESSKVWIPDRYSGIEFDYLYQPGSCM